MLKHSTISLRRILRSPDILRWVLNEWNDVEGFRDFFRSQNGRAPLSKAILSMIAVLLVAVALGSGFVGLKRGARYQINAECCQISPSRSLVVSAKEILGLATFYSQMGQDRWVSEAVFPGVKNGFFLDVGSGDGTLISNTKALE
jgi:hypothetical protein